MTLPERTLPPPQPVQLVPSHPRFRCVRCRTRVSGEPSKLPEGLCPGCGADLADTAIRQTRASPDISLRERLRLRDGPMCHYCGEQAGTTIDEKRPRSLGGERTMDNCVLACPRCNGQKGSTPYEEFLVSPQHG
jgi:HNH endonuclease